MATDILDMVKTNAAGEDTSLVPAKSDAQGEGQVSSLPISQPGEYTGDELLSLINGNTDKPGDSDNTIPDEYKKLSKTDLVKKIKETETARAGFQSAHDSLQSKFSILEGKVTQMSGFQAVSAQAPPQQPPKISEVNPPVASDFLKDVDTTDPVAVATAQGNYYDALLTYKTTRQEEKIIRNIKKREAEEKVMSKARELAALDPKFRLPNGEPNIREIHRFVDNSTSDWVGLYKASSVEPAAVPPASVPKKYTEDEIRQLIHTSALSHPQSVSNGGNGSTTDERASTIPSELKDVIKTSSNFSLPVDGNFKF